MLTFKSQKLHDAQVEALQKKMRQENYFFLSPHKTPSNTLRNGYYKKKGKGLDLSCLNQILMLNEEEAWVTVEPRMTVSELAKITLKAGFLPAVVPEFRSITVGGAIMGAALESSSFKEGQFNDSVIDYEVLTGDGTCLTVSREMHSDLFYALPGSYGTLAILTLVKLKLRKAASHVLIQGHAFTTPHELLNFFQTSPPQTDFLDGIIFSPTECIAITGTFSPRDENIALYKPRKWYSQWFYVHVFGMKSPEQMPTLDYLFRFDRGAFWMGRYLLSWRFLIQIILQWKLASLVDKIKKRNTLFYPSFFLRVLFGWAFSSRFLYYLCHKVPKPLMEHLFFIQDFYAPSEKAEEVLEHFMKKTEMYPIWLCPLKGTLEPQFLSPHFKNESLVNIGLYGKPKCASTIPVLTKELEKSIIDFGGRKMLYSYSYYEKEIFASIYHETQYLSLRKKYNADNVFPSLYDKVV